MDGIERELRGQARVVRVNIQDGVGRRLAAQHQVFLVPTFILFDDADKEVWRQSGRLPDRQRILAEVRLLTQ